MSLSVSRIKLNLFSFLDLNRVFQQTETDNIFSMKLDFQTLKEFMEKIKRATTDKEIAALSFDVMWAVLTALKNTYKKYPLEVNTNERGNITCTLYLKKQLQNQRFEGLTVSKLISIKSLNILSYSG